MRIGSFGFFLVSFFGYGSIIIIISGGGAEWVCIGIGMGNTRVHRLRCGGLLASGSNI
jgi:hypothetical protein